MKTHCSPDAYKQFVSQEQTSHCVFGLPVNHSIADLLLLLHVIKIKQKKQLVQS